MRKIRLLWRANAIWIVLFCLTAGAFVLWMRDPEAGGLGDFGLNAFTEMLSVSLTVLILDSLIAKRQEKQKLPLNIAMYNEVRLFTTHIVDFWTEVFRQSVAEQAPVGVKELFTEDCFRKMFNNLWIEANPNVTPPRTWRTWFAEEGNIFQHKGNKILDRYSSNLPPEIFQAIHQLTENGAFLGCMNMIQNIYALDCSQGIPRPQVLGAYYPMPQVADFEALLLLHKWCQDEYINLSSAYGGNLFEVTKGPQGETNRTPNSMIPETMLQQQIMAMEQFQSNSSSN